MKMAIATPRDIDAAGELLQLLDAIDERFGGPWAEPDAPDDLPEFLDGEPFNSSDEEHLKVLYNHLARLLQNAPNFHGRVIGGMCYVVMYNKNEIVDLNSNVLDLHPKLRGLLNNLAPTP
ncbi:hypothetical protein [Pseudomonas citronellolis]|uniref:hypothetical protein n=1 Tax=Pseudomonas citronellolis TaxID=53408 RepID=UPI000718621C|nr:hypothetical protein [Pseudomonas citronellolis]KRV74535.1 hypothetical protein AO742_14995 [Pseudomonas citronellolis]KRW78542.1 hypothetical protein AO738_12010 [Pseudomonas citronellolis]